MKKEQIPNQITCVRIVIAFLLAGTKLFTVPFYLLYVLGGVTDAADGLLARHWGVSSKLGVRLDSIADFLLFAVIIMRFLITVRIPILYWIGAAVISVIKALTMVCGMCMHRKVLAVHTYANKLAGAVVFTIPLFYDMMGTSIVYMAVIFVICVYAAIEECSLVLVRKVEDPDVKGWFL